MPKFLQEIQLPSLDNVIKPKEGLALYNRDGKLYTLDANGNEKEVGAGVVSGGGGGDGTTVDLSNYYTKTETDNKINDKVADKLAELVGTAPETLNTIQEIADALQGQDTAIDALENTIGNKANSADVYTKTEIDDKLANFTPGTGGGTTVDLSNYYTKEEVDAKIANFGQTSVIIRDWTV